MEFMILIATSDSPPGSSFAQLTLRHHSHDIRGCCVTRLNEEIGDALLHVWILGIKLQYYQASVVPHHPY